MTSRDRKTHQDRLGHFGTTDTFRTTCTMGTEQHNVQESPAELDSLSLAPGHWHKHRQFRKVNPQSNLANFFLCFFIVRGQTFRRDGRRRPVAGPGGGARPGARRGGAIRPEKTRDARWLQTRDARLGRPARRAVGEARAAQGFHPEAAAGAVLLAATPESPGPGASATGRPSGDGPAAALVGPGVFFASAAAALAAAVLFSQG